MAISLRPGEFLGSVSRRTPCGDAALSEVLHTAARDLPQHQHESPYFCLLVTGDYSEEVGQTEIRYRPGSLACHPPQMSHRDRIGRNGGRFFMIELQPRWLEVAARAFSVEPSLDPAMLDGDMAVLAMRLFRHYRDGTLAAESVEAVIWELLGCRTRSERLAAAARPPWLDRCLDLLRDVYHEPVTVAAVAKAVGVHPVHLSREFRRRIGETVGEYLHRLRVQAACARIAARRPLVEVAFDCGFSDQSHFNRVFKRLVGCSPGRFQSFVANP